MPNPNIAEAGRATRFQKGNVPLSPGRPKRSPITDRYATIADLPAPDYLLAALKLSAVEKPAIKTYGDALALSRLFRKYTNVFSGLCGGHLFGLAELVH